MGCWGKEFGLLSESLQLANRDSRVWRSEDYGAQVPRARDTGGTVGK